MASQHGCIEPSACDNHVREARHSFSKAGEHGGIRDALHALHFHTASPHEHKHAVVPDHTLFPEQHGETGMDNEGVATALAMHVHHGEWNEQRQQDSFCGNRDRHKHKQQGERVDDRIHQCTTNGDVSRIRVFRKPVDDTTLGCHILRVARTTASEVNVPVHRKGSRGSGYIQRMTSAQP